MTEVKRFRLRDTLFVRYRPRTHSCCLCRSAVIGDGFKPNRSGGVTGGFMASARICAACASKVLDSGKAASA